MLLRWGQSYLPQGIDAQGQKVQIVATQLKMFCIFPCSQDRRISQARTPYQHIALHKKIQIKILTKSHNWIVINLCIRFASSFDIVIHLFDITYINACIRKFDDKISDWSYQINIFCNNFNVKKNEESIKPKHKVIKQAKISFTLYMFALCLLFCLFVFLFFI